MGNFRTTLNLLRVIAVLYADLESEHYGLELSRASRVSDGALYPILDKLEDGGLIVARWEEIDERAAGRRRRCYYRLTAEGVAYAREHQHELPALARAGAVHA